MKCGIVLFAAAVIIPAGSATAGTITKGKVTSSATCGECHRDIYRMWSGSAHARSLEDPVFQTAYQETETREGTAVGRVCLGCHAPIAAINGDSALKLRVTWEGVSCDVCHSIVSVEMTPAGAKQVLDVGLIKRGPIRDAASSAHEVAYSELHTRSLVCAGCHEFVNAEGTPIMTTFSEWSRSKASETGKNCQTCHMGRTEADIVDPRIARVPDAEVNLHEVPGGHSLEQLHKALRAVIDPSRDGDTLNVTIRLINDGAGHAVPTGMPGRRVILDLKVKTSDGQAYEDHRVYTKSFVDAEGQPINRDSGYFAKGVRFASDTRIQPDERRVETFRWPVPTSATAYITLKLHYEHAPTGGEEDRTYLTFLSEERVVMPGSGGSGR